MIPSKRILFIKILNLDSIPMLDHVEALQLFDLQQLQIF